MKIYIDGDINEEKMVKIGKLLLELYKGTEDHINIIIEDNNKTRDEMLEIYKKMGFEV